MLQFIYAIMYAIMEAYDRMLDVERLSCRHRSRSGKIYIYAIRDMSWKTSITVEPNWDTGTACESAVFAHCSAIPRGAVRQPICCYYDFHAGDGNFILSR